MDLQKVLSDDNLPDNFKAQMILVMLKLPKCDSVSGMKELLHELLNLIEMAEKHDEELN